MNTLPATYLELRATLILRRQTFASIARELKTTTQFVRNTCMTYWGRSDVIPQGKLTIGILDAVEAMLLEDYQPPNPRDLRYRTKAPKPSMSDASTARLDEDCVNT